MELRLYDTLSREKRTFAPLDAKNVRMYVCGPTVYDFAHIGNARPVIVFDVLFRLLRHVYGEAHVKYVRNITDVDDKINARALRDYPGLLLNDAIRKVTEATASQFQADVKALGCLDPTHQPRATDFVLPRGDGRADMKSLIQDLLDRNHAYLALGDEGKEILFDVSSMPDYGALSKRKLDEQIPGARIAVDSHKRNAEDFVLWKESGVREPGWKGEFRPNPKSGYDAEFTISRENASRLQLNSQVVAIHGRPGWHIECSAMSAAYLGNVFDIHGGGIDLIFPHHENEIAQSRCAHGTSAMANFWMHNGFVEVEGKKMSKSDGNFVTIHELLQDWPGEVLRLNMLKTHYRSPIDWTIASLEESKRELQTWANALENTEGMLFSIGQREMGKPPVPAEKIVSALADDLNTSQAITELRAIFSQFRSGNSQASIQLMQSLEFLGLARSDRLGLLNPYHVGTGGRLASPAMKRNLDLLQIAAANDDSARQAAIVETLLTNGVRASVHTNGSIEYEVFGDGVNVDELIRARSEARARKDFKESDRIRDLLARMGVTLRDFKDPVTGEIKTEVAR
ncbi:cysteine--tRNA ligase [Bradyrhizobium manausense]|uniref:cysteine--tRNA ligase n=1 Tax=Bradyrhizobium manausense TaxID=989370 RepID=UPI001BAD65FF|nr:cysteine--tRNA ligase [Bradyrhizobium manausense]MBR0722730.1 cysteine--tRNA ligase [Bradyrhizobium manausense]